jgi:hypothetical protein
MDNISSQIGALELSGQPESYADGVLEASVQGPQPGPPVTAFCSLGCRIGDDALEAAGANIALAPTQIGCRSTLVRACSPSAA